jgi:hypothetical protein
MALFKLPLSGDVVQWINPVTWFASGNQITANVYLGESSSPETEAEILDRRQLSILRLQSRFIFGNKRTNLIGHVQKFQPLLFI